ncbi:MAG: SusC/RagA family TonB-linked outer membrane protein, partial [Muribaculaceae bacterium]|nr:SusC/RagA family TonB-linked outer membrane protein [Muribaculaceae bacterium]
IDGVMTRDNPSTIINSNDVESIQVLKDAASASIYGAQSANGVIIITTKRAKAGNTHVTFDLTWTLQNYKKGLSLLDADQWGQVYWSAYKNANNGMTPNSLIYGSGPTPKLQSYNNLNGVAVAPQTTDWEDEIHRTALMQTYTLGLSKGSENGSSSMSLSWLGQDGIVKGTDYQKINSRFSSDYGFINNRLKVGGSATINWWKAHNAPGGIEENAVKQHPAKAAFDVDGNYNESIVEVLGDTPNLLRLIDNEANNKNEYWRILGNAWLQIEPVKNLFVKTSFGVNFFNETHKYYTPAWLRDENNYLEQNNGQALNWVWTNTAQYNIDFGKNSVMALIGVEAKKDHSEWLGAKGSGLILDDPNFTYLENVTTNKATWAGAENYSMFSLFGKFNYTWDDKYLASLTIRRDASSRLSHDHNYDWFPSLSLGWRISQENFMESTRTWLSDLKLRGSYGINGNDIISNTAYYSIYSLELNQASYNITGDGGSLGAGAKRTQSVNPDLTWEKTYQWNAGIDASILNNQLMFSLDYFHKDTHNMLVQKPYIATVGEGGYMWYNGGEMLNQGFEAQINWQAQVNRNFSYDIGFNVTYQTNKVTDLMDDIYYNYGGGRDGHSLVGQPLGSWMMYKTDGVFHTQAEVDEYVAKYQVQHGAPGVGRLKYVDVNNDGIINDDDRTWCGSDLPKAQFGLNLGARWKQFDISLFFNSVIRDAYNNSKFYTHFFQGWSGNHGMALYEAMQAYDKYLETGYYDSDIPAPTTSNLNEETGGNDYIIENGSFLRLKTLSIGYTLPANLLSKLRMSNARIYLQGQNLFTVTKYKGADPEGLGYPYSLPRQFTLGIQFGF